MKNEIYAWQDICLKLFLILIKKIKYEYKGLFKIIYIMFYIGEFYFLKGIFNEKKKTEWKQ